MKKMIFDEEILFTYIGYAAGLATVLTFTIQIMRIIETKNVTNMSSYMYTIYSLGLVCWFAYGVYIDSYILVISNLITFICTFIILMMILYYDAEDKIEKARRDDITSVYNYKYFTEAAAEKIAQSLINDQNFAVMMLKVENIQELKDKYGLKFYNKILKLVGSQLEKDLRGSDLIARLDEEKFIIFLANSDEKGAKTVANRLLESAKNLNIKLNKKQNINITSCIGACTSKYGKSLISLTENTEKALYNIPAKSKTKIKFHNGK